MWAGSEQPNRHAVGMPSLLSAIFTGQISELLLGSGPRNRVHRTSSRKFKTSGSSEAWYRARFGTERSRVRIPPSRPLTKSVGRSDSQVEHRSKELPHAGRP